MGRGATGWEDRRRREATLGGSLVYGYLAAFNVVMAAGWCLVAATLVAPAIFTGSPPSALHLAFTNVGSLVRTPPISYYLFIYLLLLAFSNFSYNN
jgi:hypothetical protein